MIIAFAMNKRKGIEDPTVQFPAGGREECAVEDGGVVCVHADHEAVEGV